MWNILICFFFITSCNLDNHLNTVKEKVTNSENKKVYIIGSGFNLNNEGTINLKLFKECLQFDPIYLKLSTQNNLISFDLDKNCNQLEINLSSLIGHNDQHILYKGDTLHIKLQKDGVMVYQSNKQYWESNFYYEVNKNEIGSNLFYTKYLYKNKGRKPTRTELLKQVESENNLLDSLYKSQLITKTSFFELKDQVALNTLCNLIRMGDNVGYEKMNESRLELVKKDDEIIKGSLAKTWILKELLSYRLNLPVEEWDKRLDLTVFDTINKYYSGIFRDFLKIHILVNLYPEKINDPERSIILGQLNSIEYKKYLKESFNNDDRKASLGHTQVLNQKAEVYSIDSILKFNGITFIDFWASWCAPCRAEMPFSKKLQKNFVGQPIQFVYISIDEKLAAWQKANQMEGLSEYQKSYLLAHPADAEIVKKLNITTIPRYIIMGPDGKIHNRNAPHPSDPSLKVLLDKYIALLNQ